MCWVYRYLKCVIILFVTFNCSCLCNKTDKGEQTTIKKGKYKVSKVVMELSDKRLNQKSMKHC